MKKFIILMLFVVAIFASLAINILNSNGYNKGKIPVKDENKYFIQIKDRVFTDAIRKDNPVIKVVNSSKYRLQLCAASDTAKFFAIFSDKDSMAQRTVEKFNGRGFEWVVGDSIQGTYFSLPREKCMNDANDYVTVPVWLIAKLLDEKIIDKDFKIIGNNNEGFIEKIKNSCIEFWDLIINLFN